MDGIIAATARAISFIGAAALKSSAGSLAKLARSVLLAVDGAAAAAPSQKLTLDVEQLESALQQSKETSESISALLEAAAGLEAALGADLDAVRREVAKLVSMCKDHECAVKEMEQVRDAEAESERRDAAPARWWWRIWGRRRRRRVEGDGRTPLLDDVSNHQVAIRMLTEETERAHQLKNEAKALITSFANISEVNDELVSSLNALKVSVTALEQGEDRLELIISIGQAAINLEGALGAQIGNLRSGAADLVRKCQEHQHGADAMVAVQHAARMQARQWWRFWELCQPSERVLEGAVNLNLPRVPSGLERAFEGAVNPNLPPAPSDLGQGDGRRSGMSGFALFGCLSLATALGAGAKEKPKVMNPDDLWWIVKVLCLWFTIVSGGVLSSPYARTLFELVYAVMASRLGIFGINVLFILFLHWYLNIAYSASFYALLGFAAGVHLTFFCLALKRRDWS